MSTPDPPRAPSPLPPDLQAVFAENRPPLDTTSPPLGDIANLSLPAATVVDELVPPALPPGASPYRVLFADDSGTFLEGIRNSADAGLKGIVDLRTWHPEDGSLVECILEVRDRTRWEPELLVLDINMGQGGHNGLDYLRLLRDPVSAPGLAALPIVLATGNYKRDVDRGELLGLYKAAAGTTLQKANKTGVNPAEWQAQATPAEPDAILYGKQGDQRFIVRVLEQLPLWQLGARRRAWHQLLATVAERLDHRNPQPEKIGQWVAEYAERELGVCDVFVRWRDVGVNFKLIGCRSKPAYETIGSLIDPATIPLLAPLVAGSREPVVNNQGVTASSAGPLAARLAGKKMLAASALLDDTVVGYVTMFRQPRGNDFDTHVDAAPLALLARLLASALGRAEALRAETERDAYYLKFANSLVAPKSVSDIAQGLAQLVHRAVNRNNDHAAEVTVRLVNYNKGSIERFAHVGIDTTNPEIHLWDSDSMIQRVVKSGKFEISGDITPLAADGKARQRISESAMGALHSELCVPLLSGAGAIGAVNAEHLQRDVYDAADASYVQSAAVLAAAAIQRLQASSFLARMAAFASHYADLNAAELRRHLVDLLIDFSGASALVRLEAPTGSDVRQPWSVGEDVEVRLVDDNPDVLRRNLISIYRDQWNQTTIGSWIAEERWNGVDCEFAARSNVRVFRQRGYELRPSDGPRGIEEAIAALWLRHNTSEAPYACVLLLWFFKPGLTPDDSNLLGAFARLLSALETRRGQAEAWMRTAIIGEQAQALGMVYQHLRHRLKSDLGSLKGLAQDMDLVLRQQPSQSMHELVKEFHAQIEVLSGRFHKSIAYIKTPEPQTLDLRAIHRQAAQSIPELGTVVPFVDETPEGLTGWGDPDIYELALFTLFDNAVEALDGVSMPTVRVASRAVGDRAITTVSDNGPGIAPAIRDRLFEFGVRTKPHGLGSALAFAQIRCRIAGGGLRLESKQREQVGASFAVTLARQGWQPSLPSESIRSDGEAP